MTGRKGETRDVLVALSAGLADAVELVGPSVVRVNGRRRRPASSVVYAPGLVLAASHAVEREEDLSVSTHDGRTLEARLVGRDPGSDLAVLEVDGLELDAAKMAEAAPRVGQIALAVGRTGEGARASFGVVSAVGGPLRKGRRRRAALERYVQTDATAYPGFSGGPLVDAEGSVIGVMTSGLARGVTLAVPAGVARRVAEELVNRGRVKRGYLGILSQPVRLPATQSPDGRSGGLLVVGVEEGAPAHEAGMLVGDVVVTLDGQSVEETEDLQVLLSGERVGEPVPVGVLRGGEPRTLDVTVGERRAR